MCWTLKSINTLIQQGMDDEQYGVFLAKGSSDKGVHRHEVG